MSKELVAFNDQQGYVRVKWSAGGELPEVLSGIYTSFHEAEKAITSYVNTKSEKTNAKSKDREAV